jgi:hypothetical protein
MLYELREETKKLNEKMNIEPIEDKYLDEIIKTKDLKLHVTASVIGGMAA